MSEPPEFEELEQIPWSALAVKTPDSRTRLVYVALAVAATLGLGLLAVRWLLPGDGQSTVALPPVASAGDPVDEALAAGDVTVGEVDAAGRSTVAVGPIPPESPVSAAVGLYSEADLMAIAVDDELRLATMRAEWFVQDYFTVDGDQQLAGELAALVGDVALPHSAPTGSSYVEWARAFSTTSPAPGRYIVDVAYRVLSSATDGSFVRMPVRAVAITLEIDIDGSTTIIDLPASTEVPATNSMPAAAGAPGTPPEDLIAVALLSVQGLGIEAEVLEVTSDGSAWRFIVSVADPSGIRWPITVVLPST
ncbi:MAG: hypothetical protein U9N84_01925 [Actinomycetota bacterium]|nr:hypothetical protein [Actinomycetota bacterium]